MVGGFANMTFAIILLLIAGGCVSLVAMAILLVGARAEDGERRGGKFTVLPHRRMNPPHGPVDIG